MRIALIADIHGNLVSLDAVLTDVAHESAELVVCLGDVAASGPRPREVLAKLRELGCPIVMGNADAWLLGPVEHPATTSQDVRKFAEIDRWCLARLSVADLDFVRTFRSTVPVLLGGDLRMLCVHGSPRSNTEIVTATTPDDELEAMLRGVEAQVVAGGHTHTPMLRRHRDWVVLNPGSVGLPYERRRTGDQVRNPPWAEYAIITVTDDRFDLQFRRVPVDLVALSRSVPSDMPHADWWIHGWGSNDEVYG